MNQTSPIINLREFTEVALPHGNAQGKKTYSKLVDYVDERPDIRVFGVSLAEIEATDASFPRESVVSAARHYRCERGFFLIDVKTRDMVDNWRYAAVAKEQPLVIWYPKNEFEIIGPEDKVSSATLSLVSYVLQQCVTTASQVALEFDMTIQNASTRLKKLYTQGYILRSEVVAETGGIEFRYEAIK